ncbi:hypothetical protein SI65_08225 [Aspergillus cristatus]|uniref:Major facilitator superfamily (MFS) profile domain-containing protein n=1 Tax=Aspergillus cristatus TaxID=573508 RepID=A0A1E3B742_ASPCR|nr:hypothetical protein SI65_08225 [Aspergillus cristatus]
MGAAENEIEKERTPPQQDDFPEGGVKAWGVVAGAFCVLFCTFGYLNAYDVYQDYYQGHQLSHESSSTISWIGSVQVFFLYAGGVIGGPFFDWIGAIVIIPPAFLFVFAMMMTSLCKEYYQFMLAQGILGGFCCGMMFAPAMAAVGQYFRTRRALAMGGVRIVGLIILALLVIACATVRRRLPPCKGNILVLSAFPDPSYILTIASLFLLIWGMFTPFFYIETYATYCGMSSHLASYMLSILNAASIVGRIIPAILADRFSNFTLLFTSGACTGVLLLCWMAIKSNAAIIVFAALYGLCSGAIVSLLSPCIAQIVPHPSLIGAYLGMAFLLVGVSGLTGTPICGALIDGYGWWAAMVFSGVAVFMGSGLALVTQFTLMRRD